MTIFKVNSKCAIRFENKEIKFNHMGVITVLKEAEDELKKAAEAFNLMLTKQSSLDELILMKKHILASVYFTLTSEILQVSVTDLCNCIIDEIINLNRLTEAYRHE